VKKFILVVLLFKMIPLLAQEEDSSSALEILYSEAKKKDEELNKYRRFGVSTFVGMGRGGNDLKKGFAYGVTARTHYYGHTFNIYFSQARKDELLYSNYTYSLVSNNFGLIYGPGLHSRSFTASFGAGVGYYNTSIDRHNVTFNHPTYQTYQRAALCFGAQACLHEKIFGLTFQVFYNTANPFTNVTTMGGIEFILK
jgi:hypothetical protein